MKHFPIFTFLLFTLATLCIAGDNPEKHGFTKKTPGKYYKKEKDENGPYTLLLYIDDNGDATFHRSDRKGTFRVEDPDKELRLPIHGWVVPNGGEGSKNERDKAERQQPGQTGRSGKTQSTDNGRAKAAGDQSTSGSSALPSDAQSSSSGPSTPTKKQTPWHKEFGHFLHNLFRVFTVRRPKVYKCTWEYWKLWEAITFDWINPLKAELHHWGLLENAFKIWYK